MQRVFKRWQELYSDELHLSLKTMSSKDRADNSKLEKRIEELEKQLKLAQMKNVALNAMIDIAEKDYKLAIRKKSGPKQ
jgi:transposase